MNIRRVCAALTALLVCCAPLALAQEEAQSQLSWMLGLYGAALDVTPAAPEGASQACGAAQVTLAEALYDGRWLFTAVHVAPAEGGGSLVMPALASENAPTCGINGELPETEETFAQAAEAAGQGLCAVLAYPAIFDDPQQAENYFLDYRMLADGSFMLFSGAAIVDGGETVDATLQVTTQAVLPEAGETESWTLPAAAALAAPLETITYVPQAADSPLSQLQVVRTALGAYAEPLWAEAAWAGTRAELLDAAGAPLPPGSNPMDACYAPEALTDTLEVALSGPMAGLEPLRLTVTRQE